MIKKYMKCKVKPNLQIHGIFEEKTYNVVTFTCSTADFGNVLWIAFPLIQTNVHDFCESCCRPNISP